jgi:hypothetical protein
VQHRKRVHARFDVRGAVPPIPPKEDPQPRFGIGHNQGSPPEDPPEISPEAPKTAQEVWGFVKAAARWLAGAGVRRVLTISAEAVLGGPVGDFMLAVEATYWLYYYRDTIYSFLDPPKTLEELRQNPKFAYSGYEEHHIVEQWSEGDGIPRSKIDSPENLVRIPTVKHWELNKWLDAPNEKFLNPEGNMMSPRQYMKGKSWEERYRFGLDALVRFGVLKP